MYALGRATRFVVVLGILMSFLYFIFGFVSWIYKTVHNKGT
jgi:hypothetical protein